MFLFISDLHLCSSRPVIVESFRRFLAGRARGAQALYILGDLFEYWAGDDDLDDPFNSGVACAIAACAAAGTRVFFMRGNRDFLAGEAFAGACRALLLEDPAVIDLYGTRTALMHGDTLCTDDEDYQRFRREVRSPEWVEAFLAAPLAERKARIEALRRRSEEAKRRKPPALMDVNGRAVQEALRAHRCTRLIHGHTHRPARHDLAVDGAACERWVLTDWYERGGVLVCDAAGCRAQPVE